MELAQIKHFIAVAETGSFTKGAKRAAVSQPAISASIARLEAELDVKLVDRRHTPVVPTPAGIRLLEAGKAILYACNKVKGELKTHVVPKHLRIGVLQSLSSRYVSKLLGSLLRDAPFLAVQVLDGTATQLMEWLASERVELALTIFDEHTAELPGRVLFKEPYVLAVPEGHRFLRHESVKLADLRDEPFIVRTRCNRFQAVTDALVARGINPRVVYETDQDDRALALVATGMGVALVPAPFETADVRHVPVSDLGLARSIGLLWNPERAYCDIEPLLALAGRPEWTSQDTSSDIEWFPPAGDAEALRITLGLPENPPLP